jgi:uncharacterized DUF497 family protein
VFTWTEEKNQLNKKKHGFSLSEIVDVFDDPHLIDWYDKNHSSINEDRYICLGRLHDAVTLFVVFTERGENIHLIWHVKRSRSKRGYTMPITKKRLEEIKAFKNTDFSDSPVLTEEQMKEFKPSHLRNMANYKPIKKTINVRLDADVIEWLQSEGRGYQTRMNTILREAMLHSGS